jgi:4-hydroxy-tetrahydrodipicolinate synthase
LLQRVGGLNSFSVFVGTGPLMASGLLRGARGIVPSVGNLAPGLCRALYDCASRGDKEGTEVLNHKFLELAQVYQKGRTLGESLAALKGAMACLGLCGPQVFAPLKPVSPAERRELGAALSRLGLIGPKGGMSGFADASECRPAPASGC